MSLPNYDSKTDEELMRLALDAGSLTAEAKSALVSELKKRRLDFPNDLAAFDKEQRHYKHLDDINLGNPTLIIPYGVGRRAYGRANVETLGMTEEYDTTVFGAAFYLPLLPMGAYRFSREQGSRRFAVLQKKPLNWNQMFSVWLKAAAIVCVVIVLALFLSRK